MPRSTIFQPAASISRAQPVRLGPVAAPPGPRRERGPPSGPRRGCAGGSPRQQRPQRVGTTRRQTPYRGRARAGSDRRRAPRGGAAGRSRAASSAARPAASVDRPRPRATARGRRLADVAALAGRPPSASSDAADRNGCVIDPSDQSRKTGPISPRMTSSAVRSPCSRLSGTAARRQRVARVDELGMRARRPATSAAVSPPGRPTRSSVVVGEQSRDRVGEPCRRGRDDAGDRQRGGIGGQDTLDLGQARQGRGPGLRSVAERRQRRPVDVLGDDPTERGGPPRRPAGRSPDRCRPAGSSRRPRARTPPGRPSPTSGRDRCRR